MADKVKLVYAGAHAAVDVPVLDLVDVAVGDEVEVPAEVAAELVERGDWKEVAAKVATPAPVAQKEGK